ncbi:MAG: GNAT family N-acetyltransferase [bacterium]
MATYDFKPATAKLWSDLVQLFGERGACGGCWCMSWRLSSKEFDANKGAGNRRALKRIVDSGEVPGIIAYCDSEPVGWCSVAPRERFPRLARARTLKPIDDKPVWSVVCLFVLKGYRNQGVSVRLLKAAAEYVRLRGGKIVEGYPYDPKEGRWADPFVYTGLVSAFKRAGFKEVARPSTTRAIMRRVFR